jgi:putative phosphoesterase
MVVGVISDTHGLLRPEALAALRGSEVILHAGDIGSRDVLDNLGVLAPVIAVRGNVDEGAWTRGLFATQAAALGQVVVYLLHDLHQLDLDPRVAGIAAVIHGHSHKPTMEWKDGVLYFNPGSAGPRRFKLPVSVGRLVVDGAVVRPELIELA